MADELTRRAEDENLFLAIDEADRQATINEPDTRTSEGKRQRLQEIDRLIAAGNVAAEVKANNHDLFKEIGASMVELVGEDLDTMSDWFTMIDDTKKIASQLKETRTWAGETVASIKYPQVAQASIQFSSRAYPQLVQKGQLVRGVVFGPDENGEKAARAERISNHMTYQLIHQDDCWEEEMDYMLCCLPLMGAQIKLTYRDMVKKRNRSVVLPADDFIINYWEKSVEAAYRKTRVLRLSKNEIIERERRGLFLKPEMEYPLPNEDSSGKGRKDAKPTYIFYEVHTFYDLDDDEYEEPWVITVHKDTSQVVRIAARYDSDGVEVNEKGEIVCIEPVEHFTRYLFMPDENGGIMGKGFGTLLTPINDVINTIINQILDAGSLANRQCGIVAANLGLNKGRLGGSIAFAIGEFKVTDQAIDDIRKYVFTMPFKEPSMALFRLLELMIQAGDKLASVSDLLTGGPPVANEPATSVLARIEQGLKVFSAIYKRVFRGLRSELKKLARLNKLYMDDSEYYRFHDTEGVVARQDYETGDCDVAPVADPNTTTQTQAIMKSQAIMALRGQGYNDDEITRRFLEALQIDGVDKIIPKERQPSPDAIMAQQKMRLETENFRLKIYEAAIAWAKTKSEIVKNRALATKAIADAEAAEAGQQLEQYKAHLASIDTAVNLFDQAFQMQNFLGQQEGGQPSEGTQAAATAAGNQPGGGEGMGAGPGNEGVPAPTGGPAVPEGGGGAQRGIVPPGPTGAYAE